ncbi:MAG: helix-turn-helix domain-containing protein [Pseudomonadales bacterium]|nr:helix-turn-helix domain-containing protein [Pseudomonadales bacterium]
MKHVTVLAIPRALGTSITLPIEMLNAADAIMRIQSPSHSKMEIEIASIDGNPVEMTGGIEIRPHKKLALIESTDLVMIPALWGNPKPVIRQYPFIIKWIKKHHENGALICATGTGCCFLAETGLLDYKPATTHWYYFKQFKKNYPRVKLETKRFITSTGNLFCAGRINSITNLMIHFIEQFYNHDIARQIEQHFAHEIKQSYESIFYSFDEESVHHDETIIQAQQWMLRNYPNDFKLHSVAEQFDMSLRTFNRRFKLATGSTPLEYLQKIRIGTAKDLLQESNLGISEISAKVGFTDPSYFASLFKRRVSLSPREYRKLVRAKLFSVTTI